MSTPTPTHPAQPSSASKKTAGHVTTPSHLGLSPAPRSIPSPAATRKEHAGKTPVNHPTVSSQSSKTFGGSTPMMQTLSQTGFTVGSASPGTQMIVGSSGGGSSSYGGISLGTPLAGLGVDLGGGIGGSGVGSVGASGGGGGGSTSGTPGLGGAALMATSVSELGRELGLTVSGGSGARGGAGAGAGGAKRNEDEERRARMRRVLTSIGRPKGRVSEEAIARVSRRVGFQNDIDAEELTAEEKERKVGNRTISIAGKTILVDVELSNHVAQNVQVMFSGNGKGLEEQGTAAGKVLLSDLQVVDGVSLNANLDRFALDLDRLARTDRLSERVNCFEAISGLYTSLRHLYELEKETVKATLKSGISTLEHRADMETMCKRSGRPVMHDHGEVGLSIDYWSVDQYGPDEKSHATAMEIDGDPPNRTRTSDPDVFSLRIEVEGSPAALYPSIRVSDHWLPESFELAATASDRSIPWEDPPPTYLSGDIPGGSGDGMVIDDTHKLPDLRFVAKLDPPIVLPLQTAVIINNALGVSMPQAFPFLETYHGILLKIKPEEIRPGAPNLTSEQHVLSAVNGEETEVLHKYGLDVSKPDWGYRLEELPFSHPRQLVELLPTLRQWAYLGTLIQQAFAEQNSKVQDGRPPQKTKVTTSTKGMDVGNLSLDDLVATSSISSEPKALLVDLTLSTSPQPTVSVTFPELANPNIDNMTVQILPNGDVSIPTGDETDLSDNADSLDEAMKKGAMQSDLAKRNIKALNICGDLGVWIEWMMSSQK